MRKETEHADEVLSDPYSEYKSAWFLALNRCRQCRAALRMQPRQDTLPRKVLQLHREGPQKFQLCKHETSQGPASRLQFTVSICNRGWKCLFLNILQQCSSFSLSLSLSPRRQTLEDLIGVTGWQFVKTDFGAQLFSPVCDDFKDRIYESYIFWVQKDVSSELSHVPPATVAELQAIVAIRSLKSSSQGIRSGSSCSLSVWTTLAAEPYALLFNWFQGLTSTLN